MNEDKTKIKKGDTLIYVGECTPGDKITFQTKEYGYLYFKPIKIEAKAI